MFDLFSSRWNSSISLAIWCSESEILVVDHFLESHKNRPDLDVTIYIVASRESSDSNYVVSESHGTLIHEARPNPLYPINLLRDLAILQLHSSHFIAFDIDLLPSGWRCARLSRHRVPTAPLPAAAKGGAGERLRCGDSARLPVFLFVEGGVRRVALLSPAWLWWRSHE